LFQASDDLLYGTTGNGGGYGSRTGGFALGDGCDSTGSNPLFGFNCLGVFLELTTLTSPGKKWDAFLGN
jgi:hypothetical protein